MTDRRTGFSAIDIAVLLVGLAIAAIAIWIARYGPLGPIPIHYDWTGVPDQMGDRGDIALMMGGLATLIFAAAGGLGFAVRRADGPARRRGLAFGHGLSLFALGGTALFMAWAMLGTAGGQGTLSTGCMMAGVSLLILVLGGGLGRVGPNPVIGIRTPWTYKSRLSWERSNRLAGRLFFLLGLAGLVSAPFIPGIVGMGVIAALILVFAGWSVFESWRVWRDDPERTPF
jgi:uncharacterized membrane protein